MKILSETTEEFIYTLQHVEKTRNVEPLVALFSDNAELTAPPLDAPLRGQTGARNFWRKYLSVFRRVRSEVTHVIENGSEVVLEWASEAILPNGKPLQHRSVSVLQLEGGKVNRLHTYYDSAALNSVALSSEQRSDHSYQQTSYQQAS